jgi:release factor glutamine methyltransferase
MKVAPALVDATQALSATSDTARLDAELLMAHALGVSRSQLLLYKMDDDAPQGFAPLVARRAAHEPLAYITGHQEFWGLPLRVTPDTLIPRGPGAAGIGLDRSAGALAVAQANAQALGMSARAHMALGDWTRPGWSDGLGRFDLILANPPYVESDACLAPSVRSFEPAGALFAGPDGQDDYRVLIPQLADLLHPGGVAVVEIGHTQAESVAKIGRNAGFHATLHHDLAQRPRALVFSRQNEGAL